MPAYCRFEFVPMGSVLEPRAGAVALDVGNKCVDGVIDHHYRGAGDECAASMVVAHPERVTRHLQGWCEDTYTLIVHATPDLDCVISAYLARALIETGRLPDGAPALADYAVRVDSGRPLHDGLGSTSLWAMFHASAEVERHAAAAQARPVDHAHCMSRGFELLDALLVDPPVDESSVLISPDLPGWDEERTLLAVDVLAYRKDRESSEPCVVELPCPGRGKRSVRGLFAAHPTSLLFKHFARQEGFVFTHVAGTISCGATVPGTNRHIIAVAPGSGVWLRGLGKALETAELAARAPEPEWHRSGPSRWWDVTNADPWYDGRSPIHDYTIVDSPHCGTVLSLEEVRRVVADVASWNRLGSAPPDRVCPLGCRSRSSEEIRTCHEHGLPTLPVVVAGKYEVKRQIGAGGMGEVYRVVHQDSGRTLAMKIMKPAALVDARRRRRFEQEARAANKLAHPGIVKLVDLGTDAEVGRFIVTEYVSGPSLRVDMDHFTGGNDGVSREYPEERALSVIDQILDALAAVHAADVVHRDIKPDNILLDAPASIEEPARVRARLIDFGVARLRDLEHEAVTQEGTTVGTWSYMAPEVVRAERGLDGRADLYSLGLVWYELLTNTLPHERPNLGDRDLAMMHAVYDPPPVTTLRGDLRHPEAWELMRDLLARDPNQRPASAKDARARLHAFWTPPKDAAT